MLFDTLEGRYYLSAVSYSVSNGVLLTTVPGGNDTVSIQELNASSFEISLNGSPTFVSQTLLGFNIQAGAGNDSITAASLSNTSQEVLVPVTITGGAGADSLQGGKGNDSITTGSGGGLVDGAQGNDTLVGGANAQTTADYSRRNVSVTIDLNNTSQALNGQATPAYSGAAGETDILVNIQNASGGAGNDSIAGNSQNNVLVGNSGNNTIGGAGGDDTVTGSAQQSGNISGGSGNDYLFSQNGVSDTVNGGTGTNFAFADPIDALSNIGVGANASISRADLKSALGRAWEFFPDPAVPNSHAGDLDPSYSPVDFQVSQTQIQNIAGVFAVTGNKTVVVGTITDQNESYRVFLARYNSNGTLDKTFGYQGVTVTPTYMFTAHANAAAIDSQGRIVVVGESTSSAPVVIRYTADGAVDTTFGSGGIVKDTALSNTTTLVGVNTFTAVGFNAAGQIIAAGNDGGNALVVRFGFAGSDSAIDTTFGNGAFDSLINGKNVKVESLAVNPDGSVLLGLGNDSVVGANDDGVLKLTSTGFADATFGAGGFYQTSGSGAFPIDAVALQPNGEIIGGGQDTLGSAATIEINANGSGLDPSYGTGGEAALNYSGGVVQNLLIQPDGTIVASASSPTNSTSADLFWLNSTGATNSTQVEPSSASLSTGIATDPGKSITFVTINSASAQIYRFDSSAVSSIAGFGANGVATLTPLPDALDGFGFRSVATNNTILTLASTDIGDASTYDANGNLIVAGTTDSALLLKRFSSTGTQDYSFANNTGADILNFDTPITVNSVAVSPTNSDIYVGGSEVASNGAHLPFVAAFNQYGVLDTSFGNFTPNGRTGIYSGVFNNGLGEFDQSVAGIVAGNNGNLDLLVNNNANSASPSWSVVQLNNTGVLGSSFGSFGVSTPSVAVGRLAGNIILNSSGSLLVSSYVPNGDALSAVELDGSSGALTTFGSGGVATYALPPGLTFTGARVALDPTSNVLLAGLSTTQGSSFGSIFGMAFRAAGQPLSATANTGFYSDPVFSSSSDGEGLALGGLVAGVDTSGGQNIVLDAIFSSPDTDSVGNHIHDGQVIQLGFNASTGNYAFSQQSKLPVFDPTGVADQIINSVAYNGTPGSYAVVGEQSDGTLAQSLLGIDTIVNDSQSDSVTSGNFPLISTVVSHPGVTGTVVAALNDGTSIVATTDYDPYAGVSRLFLQHLTAKGANVLDLTQVVQTYQGYAQVSSIIAQPDGSYLVGGTGPGDSPLLIKYNKDGTIDPTYTPSIPGFGGILAMTLEPGGDLLTLSGRPGLSNGADVVSQFNPDGSAGSLGGGGFVYAYSPSESEAIVLNSIAVDTAGDIVLAGYTGPFIGGSSPGGSTGTTGAPNAYATRLLSDGTTDTTFANNGVFEQYFGDQGGSDFINSVAIDTHGRIYLGGSAVVNGTTQFMVVQLTTDGLLDTTDGFTGGALYNRIDNIASYSSITALKVLSGDVLLAAGYALSPVNNKGAAALAEYVLDNNISGFAPGSLYTAFGGGQQSNVAVGFSSAYSGGTGITSDVPGETTAYFTNNQAYYGNSVSDYYTTSNLAIQPDGNILLAAHSSADSSLGNASEALVARFIAATPVGTSDGTAPVQDVTTDPTPAQQASTQQTDAVIASLPTFLGPVFATNINSSGVLSLEGTTGDDNISVDYNPDINQGMYEVFINGVRQTFVPYAITGISISGGNGNDTITIDPTVKIPVTVDGGNGNDSLTAGAGSDVIDGGNGDDTLVGSPYGTGQLLGGNGNDYFVNTGTQGYIIDGNLGTNGIATSSDGNTDLNIAVFGVPPSSGGGSGGGGASSTSLVTPSVINQPSLLQQFIVTNTNDLGTGSLRAAIMQANAAGNAEIDFNIPLQGGAPAVITLSSALPAVLGPVQILGTTEPGYNGTPLVVIDGSGISAGGTNGLEISASGAFVTGLTVSGFSGNGIVVDTQGGDSVESNQAISNKGDGIFVENTGNNIIEDNLVSSNNSNGIEIGNRDQSGNVTPASSAATSNTLSGNIIGLDASKTTGAGNEGDGILVDGAPNTTIGQNIVSDNGADGIEIRNRDIVYTYTTVGASPVSTPETLLGSAANESIEGNSIGSNLNAAAGLGNSGNGIDLNDDLGSDLISSNVIDSNGNDGVLLQGAGEKGDQISGNFIGLYANLDWANAGTLGNANDGIAVIGSVKSNVIGQLIDTDPGNAIGGNGGAGVFIGADAIGNLIAGNAIDDNSGLGIALSPSSADPSSDKNTAPSNKADPKSTGGNDSLAQPLLSVVNNQLSVTVTGAANDEAIVQIFSVPVADSSGYGEGRTLLGTQTVSIGSSGSLTFVPNVYITAGTIVTATQSNFSFDTSEFSNALANPTTINAPATGGQVQFDVGNTTVNQSAGTVTVTIDRVGGSTGPGTVHVATSDGTALAGTNYTAVSEDISFIDGQTTATVTVPISSEKYGDADKVFNLTLTSPTGVTAGSPESQTITIHDDAAEPSISVANVQVNNVTSGTTTLTFDIKLSVASDVATTVQYATADGTALAGTNYVTANGTATIAAGSTDATVVVTIDGDAAYAATKKFYLNLTNPSNATLTTTQATGTIVGTAKAPSISVADASIIDTATGATLVFTVTVTGATELTTTVNFSTADGTAKAGTDYTTTSGQLSFGPNQKTLTVSVPITGEVNPLGASKTFSLLLSGQTNSNITRGTATGTINYPATAPSASIADAQVNDVTTGQTTLKFTITLSSPAPAAESVKVTATDGTAKSGVDYTFAPVTVNFIKGQTTATVTVTILGHNYYFADRAFTLTLSQPSGMTLSRATATGTIHSAFLPPTINISNTTFYDPEGNTQPEFVVLTLSNPSAQPLTFTYSTSGGTAVAGRDYLAASGTITFLPFQTFALLPIAIYASTAVQPSVTFNLTVTPAGGSPVPVGRTAAITIVNYDLGSVQTGIDPFNSSKNALYVYGTLRNDVLKIVPATTAAPAHTPAGAQGVTVLLNGVSRGTFWITGHLFLYGEDGYDSISVDPSITLATFMYGGEGNDTLVAGGGPTVEIGGNGNDVLTGSSGRSILISDSGLDSLLGGSGDAILDGGTSAYDNNAVALNALLNEWSRTDKTFAQRSADITNGGGLNGSFKLNASTTFANKSAADTLQAGSGGDLFFINTGTPAKYQDVLLGKKTIDVVINS